MNEKNIYDGQNKTTAQSDSAEASCAANKWAGFDENDASGEGCPESSCSNQKSAEKESAVGEQAAGLTLEQKQMVELEEKLTKADNEKLRLTAEIENVRRRMQTQVDDAHKYGGQKFAENMLGVLDGFEGALLRPAPENAEAKTLYDGLVLTHDMFLKALQKCGVETIEPVVGEPFNPIWHQAVSMQQDANASPNSVLQVLRRGYKINGRVIRAAMVVVNQG